MLTRRPGNEDLPSESSIRRRKGPAPTPTTTTSIRQRPISATSASSTPRVQVQFTTCRTTTTHHARICRTTPGASRERGRVGPEIAFLDKASGGLVYRVHARDLHLLRGPKDDGSAVHFRIASPGDNHGTDVSADGSGVVLEQRLYQLVRQSRKIGPPHLRDRISRSWGSRLFVHLWLRCRHAWPPAAAYIQSPMNPPSELAISLPRAVRRAGDGEDDPFASSPCGFFGSGGGTGKPAAPPNIAVAILLSIP